MSQPEEPAPSYDDLLLSPKSRPRWRLIGLAVILIIVGAVVATSLSQHSPSQTGPQKPPYQMTVDKVAEYGNSTSVDNAFFLMASASYWGGSSWDFDPLKFRLVTNTLTSYSPGLSAYQGIPLGPTTLRTGETVSGQLVFNVPRTLIPSKLNYSDTVKGVNVEVVVPQVSSWVSAPNLFPQILIDQQPQPVNSLTITGTCTGGCGPSSRGIYNFSGIFGDGSGHNSVQCASVTGSCSWTLNRAGQIPWAVSWAFASNSVQGTMRVNVTLDTGRVVFDQSTSTMFGSVSGSGSSYPSAFAVAILDRSNYLHLGYYSGETIRVQIVPGYNGGSFDPSSVQIVRITDTDTGLAISNTNPTLPITIQRNSPQFNPLTANLIAPTFSYSGPLHLTITIQSA